MTSQRVKGQLAFSCDGCPETAEPESQDFSEGWAELRKQGWVGWQERGVFHHYCPTCSEDG